MRILHFYSDNDKMVEEYIECLSSAMTGMKDNYGIESENLKTSSMHEARNILKDKDIDIVNIHGCWNNDNARLAQSLNTLSTKPRTNEKNGLANICKAPRLVLTPHGQLEPWIRKHNYATDKLPKTLIYQKNMVANAFAVIVMGKMEKTCMEQLKWTDRIEVVHNALITELLTSKEMASKILYIYGKVMDTDTFQLLDSQAQLTLASLIKAGMTGDSRWLTQREADSCSFISLTTWRRILLFAHNNSITNYILKGAKTMGIIPPDIKPALVESYSKPCPTPLSYNKNYTTLNLSPDQLTEWIKTLKKARASESRVSKLTDGREQPRLCKQYKGADIHIADLIFTSSVLRNLKTDERKLISELRKNKLGKFTNSLMETLHKRTGLDEGFMININ